MGETRRLVQGERSSLVSRAVSSQTLFPTFFWESDDRFFFQREIVSSMQLTISVNCLFRYARRNLISGSQTVTNGYSLIEGVRYFMSTNGKSGNSRSSLLVRFVLITVYLFRDKTRLQHLVHSIPISHFYAVRTKENASKWVDEFIVRFFSLLSSACLPLLP